MLFSLTLMGFLLGMRHALEADHVAAVASIATQSHSIRQTAIHGAAWGLGHTTTLFIFGGIALMLDSVVNEELAAGLEFAVGIMLILLGADVLRQLFKKRIHFHSHKHSNATQHFHAHSHQGEKSHDEQSHQHTHNKGMPKRTLCIGLMHGMAGSAALILLTLQSAPSVLEGLLYILLFGVGSIIGMAALSVVIALPLKHYAAKKTTWIYNALHISIAVTTMGIGGFISAQYLGLWV